MHPMSDAISQLVDQAGRLATAGRWQDAERTWLEVRRLEPRHPKALFSLGFHALHRGDLGGAVQLLTAAREVAPTDMVVLMTLAAAHTQRGDAAATREAIDAALAVDAYFIPALLAKGAWFEQQGSAVAAAESYRNALKIAPPRVQWPANLRPQLEHAQGVIERYARRYAAHLAEHLGKPMEALPASLAGRWREAQSIMAGLSRPQVSDSNQLYVPRLPAVPFFERDQFPWISALEAKTGVVRDELQLALQRDRDRFNPYITYRPGEPVNQWQELNHSQRWSTLALWRGGSPVPENLERCPETARALAAVEMAEISGLCPNAMFSALAPRTRIPPHHGETNARLVAHLPLIVPDGCMFRVGFEQRPWQVGKVIVFDDTLEHEARNDSDELRVVLIFDVWNPLLVPAEREMVNAMASAARSFNGS